MLAAWVLAVLEYMVFGYVVVTAVHFPFDIVWINLVNLFKTSCVFLPNWHSNLGEGLLPCILTGYTQGLMAALNKWALPEFVIWTLHKGDRILDYCHLDEQITQILPYRQVFPVYKFIDYYYDTDLRFFFHFYIILRFLCSCSYDKIYIKFIIFKYTVQCH